MITIIGDSISKYYTRKLGFKVKAIRCKNSHDLVKKMQNVSGPVAINCGLHDIKKVNGNCAVSEEKYRERLKYLIDNFDFVWITTTPVDDEMHAKRGCGFSRCNSDVDRYNEIAIELMVEAGVPIIDLGVFTEIRLDQDSFRDGVHFNPQMGDQQGKWMGEQLKMLFGEQDEQRKN